MKTFLKHSSRYIWSAIGAAILFATGSASAWSSMFYASVSGAPSSINCTNTSHSFGLGATLYWNLMSSTSQVGVTVNVNGAPVLSQAPYTFGLSGSQPLGGGGGVTYPNSTSYPYPYTVEYVVQPVDPYTDGARVTFTCASASGSAFAVSTITAPQPLLQATPAAVTFPSTGAGATTAATTITVSNTTGTADATGVAFAFSNPAEFLVSANTCGTTIAVGASCSFSVAFKPAGNGARSGNVAISRSGGPGVTIPLSGTGTGFVAPGQLSLASTLSFAAQNVATSSAPASVAVSNVGGATVNVATVSSSNPAEFAVSTTCGAVPAGAGCSINVTFTPAAAGPRSATITITSDGAGSPQTITVSGTGAAVAASGQLSLPSVITFGSQTVGTASAPSTIVVTNTGNATVVVSGVASSAPAEFPVTTTCASVAPGATCTVSVTFMPGSAGPRSGTITVTSNGTGSPQGITVSGTGADAAAAGQLAVASTVDFGNVPVGGGSTATIVAVTNIGGSAVTVSGVSSSNPAEFAIAASTCGSVAPGASCSFSVTFQPGAVGPRSASIAVNSNGIGSPQVLNASGNGITALPSTVELIEYHHAAWDHYFITGLADEITKLDNGVFVGWARTGYKFRSYPLDTPDTATVCRFFSTSFAPRSSHFYTPFAAECDIVKKNPDWQFEGNVFNMPIPALDGTCPQGTVAVYRLYNNGQGAAPNHRYTTDFTVRTLMIGAGWIPEGYGNLGVIMCAPQ